MTTATIAIPPELEGDWPCRRLVLEKIATITELETILSIDDVDLWSRALQSWNNARPTSTD